MKCVSCKSDTGCCGTITEGSRIIRRRKCTGCGLIMYSEEIADADRFDELCKEFSRIHNARKGVKQHG